MIKLQLCNLVYKLEFPDSGWDWYYNSTVSAFSQITYGDPLVYCIEVCSMFKNRIINLIKFNQFDSGFHFFIR